MPFNALNINPKIVSRLAELQITQPTDIQKLVIPPLVEGQSVVATSQTGSGKTLAYIIPIVEQLLKREQKAGVKALILAPSRELAKQIGTVCSQICSHTQLTHTTIYGGVDYEPQRQALENTPDIIIATPGRFIDLLGKNWISCHNLPLFVLDEVDQMLDLGFRDDILSLSKLRAKDGQTLCFSATIPQKVKEIIGIIMPKEYANLSLKGESVAVERITQLGYYVTMDMMDNLLIHLIHKEQPKHAIVFTRSRSMADRLTKVLTENGFPTEAMHSNRTQAVREYILKRFKDGETQIIVATDLIARGIDVDIVDYVFNFGVPQDAEQYVHRIGRTGRAGRTGTAISLCTPTERGFIDAINKFTQQPIPMHTNHPYHTLELDAALTPKQKSPSKKKKGKYRPKRWGK